MKNLKVVFFALIISGIFVGCSKDEAITLPISTPVNSELPSEARYFFSDESESDYNAYLSGKLSVTDVKEKYNLNGLPVSDKQWDEIFKGSFNITQLNTKENESGGLKLSDQIIKRVVYDRLPEEQKTQSFKELLSAQEELKKSSQEHYLPVIRSTNNNDKKIRFIHKGNVLWYSEVKVNSSFGYYISDRYSYSTSNYNDYYFNTNIVDNGSTTDQYQFNFQLLGDTWWLGYSEVNAIRTTTPYEYWHTERFAHPTVTYQIDFHFFWVFAGVYPNF